METKLSMSVMQNILATCWFYIINMCGTGIKTFFVLLFIFYMIDVFSFSFIFFPDWKVDVDLETNWFSLIIILMNAFCIWVSFEFSWEVGVSWLFVIIKSYVKVNFKEGNNNINNTAIDWHHIFRVFWVILCCQLCQKLPKNLWKLLKNSFSDENVLKMKMSKEKEYTPFLVNNAKNKQLWQISSKT